MWLHGPCVTSQEIQIKKTHFLLKILLKLFFAVKYIFAYSLHTESLADLCFWIR